MNNKLEVRVTSSWDWYFIFSIDSYLNWNYQETIHSWLRNTTFNSINFQDLKQIIDQFNNQLEYLDVIDYLNLKTNNELNEELDLEWLFLDWSNFFEWNVMTQFEIQWSKENKDLKIININWNIALKENKCLYAFEDWDTIYWVFSWNDEIKQIYWEFNIENWKKKMIELYNSTGFWENHYIWKVIDESNINIQTDFYMKIDKLNWSWEEIWYKLVKENLKTNISSEEIKKSTHKKFFVKLSHLENFWIKNIKKESFLILLDNDIHIFNWENWEYEKRKLNENSRKEGISFYKNLTFYNDKKFNLIIENIITNEKLEFKSSEDDYFENWYEFCSYIDDSNIFVFKNFVWNKSSKRFLNKLKNWELKEYNVIKVYDKNLNFIKEIDIEWQYVIHSIRSNSDWNNELKYYKLIENDEFEYWVLDYFDQWKKWPII